MLKKVMSIKMAQNIEKKIVSSFKRLSIKISSKYEINTYIGYIVSIKTSSKRKINENNKVC